MRVAMPFLCSSFTHTHVDPLTKGSSLDDTDELMRFTPPSPDCSIDSFSQDDLVDVWRSTQDDDSLGDPLDISF
jgi:hypothetical protein